MAGNGEQQMAGATYVYVSNSESEDISVFRMDRMDEAAGRLVAVQTVPAGGAIMPMALSPDRRRLYAALRSQPYCVVSFAIDPLDGRLTEFGRASLAGSMAYIAVDAAGRYLLAASYGGNLLAVNRIEDDGVAAGVQQIVGTGPCAHAIRATADNRFVFAAVLGADQLVRLDFNASTGQLAEAPALAWALPAGSGPRHFVFPADGRFVYLLDELDGKLHALAFDPERGAVEPIQSVSILPPDFHGDKPWGADLHLTPDGRFLYASERTSSTLAAFRVEADTGKLARIGTYGTQKQPRGFNIDPSGRYLFAVGQLSRVMSVYRIDAQTGALHEAGQYPVGKGANWVEVVRC
ncbi:lactonase family protein [Paraburkholderia silviterrae]|uniref:Lactonase family protein n=1 Tax=Paraburkholderia silviterrae TaxID=2528715 RepID=A0A4V2ZYR3_9BURK|nr:beta-propeller fold lactonase family protein [Paraburkholderia silviterrae]TDG21700.1 lactonase family protein [Paraburkholderia silviterrae]